jgi:hypothetical protein
MPHIPGHPRRPVSLTRQQEQEHRRQARLLELEHPAEILTDAGKVSATERSDDVTFESMPRSWP